MDVKGPSPNVSGDTGSTDTGCSVPPARTQAQRRERTRGALIDAARVLFAEQGYAGAGREEIVERAGVTRGAMYHHFNSKEALFQAVFEVVEQELCEAIALSAMAGSDPIDQLRLGARAFLEAAATGEVRRIVLLDAPAVLPIEVRRQLSERYGLGMLSASGGAIPTTYESVSSRIVSNKLPPWGLGSCRSTITTSGENEVANVRAAGPSVVALTENPRVRNAAEATRRNSASLTARSTRGASCASGSIGSIFRLWFVGEIHRTANPYSGVIGRQWPG